MKKYTHSIFICILLIANINCIAQAHFRTIIVKKDTVYEPGEMIDVNIANGLSITIVDSPYTIFYTGALSNNMLNGICLACYIPSGMPKERGCYLNNKKNGKWFYWSENGSLLKQEIWVNGKLKKTIKSK